VLDPRQATAKKRFVATPCGDTLRRIETKRGTAMKTTCGLLAAASVLALTACNTGYDTPATPTGGSAGEQGPGYCDTVPTVPEDLEQWNQLCEGQRG
jgi:hypothetical protein